MWFAVDSTCLSNAPLWVGKWCSETWNCYPCWPEAIEMKGDRRVMTSFIVTRSRRFSRHLVLLRENLSFLTEQSGRQPYILTPCLVNHAIKCNPPDTMKTYVISILVVSGLRQSVVDLYQSEETIKGIFHWHFFLLQNIHDVSCNWKRLSDKAIRAERSIVIQTMQILAFAFLNWSLDKLFASRPLQKPYLEIPHFR